MRPNEFYSFFSFCILLNCFGGGYATGHHSSGANTVCCDRDREPVDCINDCNARTCKNLLRDDSKSCSEKCYSNHCECKRGSYLNRCNVCVPKDQCEEPCKTKPIKCRGQHEMLIPCFDPNFARKCLNYPSDTYCTPGAPYELDLYHVPNENASWPEGRCILDICDCKPGFYRNKCGLCVEWHKCYKSCEPKSKQSCSDPNETRYNSWRECEARTCANRDNVLKCSSNEPTYSNKCDCRKGYYRDDCGRCIPKGDCDNQQPCICANPCKKRHQVQRCINSCTKRTCATALGLPNICKRRCSYACDCEDQYWLNRHGKCVFKERCGRKDIKRTAKWVRSEDVESEVKDTLEPIPTYDPRGRGRD